MRYCGSKRKFMKDLLPILMNNTDENTLFVDVFGGGMNVISQIPLKYKIANDNSTPMIELWNALKHHALQPDYPLPPLIKDNVSKQEYLDVKNDYYNKTHKYSPAEIGFVSTALSYGGAFFAGYANFNPNRNENHVREAYNGLMRQLVTFKHLNTTTFINDDYQNIEQHINDYIRKYNLHPSKIILFCDPPYANTRGYHSSFNNQHFWTWAKSIAINNHYILFVTEYSAPQEFTCIWAKQKKDGMKSSVSGTQQQCKTEKLFTFLH